ncbi:MAG TPA: hypothetical protein VFX12_05555 [Vicinamibacterales bacterium]|nr:hypothetical protein [Vicinamibacterales bacterium]
MLITIRRASLLILPLAGLAAGPIGERVPPAPRPGATAAIDPAMLGGLRYRMIGPYRGGRVTAVDGVASEPGTFYMGSSGGGVWKSIDYGEVWTNLSDGYFASASIGAIAASESDPRVVYAGTGSACLRGNIQAGRGLYKSTDAGATWQAIGLEDGGQIARIRIDPANPNLVYVAVQGHAFGPNVDRGVFRSRDGGKTWTKVLFVNDRTGASDLAMDPKNPSVLYATMWTGALYPWGLPSTSADGGVFKTTDGGDHWNKLAGGLPQGMVGRVGVAVSPANPSRVWALVGDVPDGGVFRSDDAGTTFRRLNTDRDLTGRSAYYAHIFSDPKDPNVVYAANRDFFKSTDGGVTFAPMPMPHGDDHALWVDPRDTRIMIVGNDGGATVSVTGGASWSSQLNQPTGEMYRVVVDSQVPYRVYGSQQDQYDALSLPSRSANFGERLQLQHWYAVGGYEGAAVAVDPRNPDVVFASGPGGRLTRYDRSVPRIRMLNITAGASGADRFAGTPPMMISPLEPQSIYNASDIVYRSTDGGQTFAAISPDLTGGAASRAAVPKAGAGQQGASWPTITALEESRKERGVLWAGTDDGIVQVTRDSGAHWTNVTPPNMPRFGLVNTIEPSPHQAGRVFLAVTAYRTDDYRPYIYRTNDYGKTWSLLTNGNGIPANDFLRVVREDPIQRGLLYAGGEFGMYVSFDDGSQWRSLQLNLPVTPVTDLVVSQGDLALSTNGRSFWILDDVAPLRALAAQTISSIHLFPPRDTYRIRTSAEEADDAYVFGACCVANARDLFTGARIERHRLGEEPPEGALIDAWFPQAPAGAVSLTVLGERDAVIRTIFDTAKQAKTAPRIAAGLNRFNWDLRSDSIDAGRRPLPGPRVPPGRYRIRLTAGSHVETAPLTVVMDPRLARVRVTEQDIQRQYDLLTRIRTAIADIERAAAALPAEPAGQLRRDLVGTGGERTFGRAGASQPLLAQFMSLYNFVDESEDQPTAAAQARWTELKEKLDRTLAR